MNFNIAFLIMIFALCLPKQTHANLCSETLAHGIASNQNFLGKTVIGLTRGTLRFDSDPLFWFMMRTHYKKQNDVWEVKNLSKLQNDRMNAIANFQRFVSKKAKKNETFQIIDLFLNHQSRDVLNGPIRSLLDLIDLEIKKSGVSKSDVIDTWLLIFKKNKQLRRFLFQELILHEKDRLDEVFRTEEFSDWAFIYDIQTNAIAGAIFTTSMGGIFAGIAWLVFF